MLRQRNRILRPQARIVREFIMEHCTKMTADEIAAHLKEEMGITKLASTIRTTCRKLGMVLKSYETATIEKMLPLVATHEAAEIAEVLGISEKQVKKIANKNGISLLGYRGSKYKPEEDIATPVIKRLTEYSRIPSPYGIATELHNIPVKK